MPLVADADMLVYLEAKYGDLDLMESRVENTRQDEYSASEKERRRLKLLEHYLELRKANQLNWPGIDQAVVLFPKDVEGGGWSSIEKYMAYARREGARAQIVDRPIISNEDHMVLLANVPPEIQAEIRAANIISISRPDFKKMQRLKPEDCRVVSDGLIGQIVLSK
jgi:hypothetical protein